MHTSSKTTHTHPTHPTQASKYAIQVALISKGAEYANDGYANHDKLAGYLADHVKAKANTITLTLTHKRVFQFKPTTSRPQPPTRMLTYSHPKLLTQKQPSSHTPTRQATTPSTNLPTQSFSQTSLFATATHPLSPNSVPPQTPNITGFDSSKHWKQISELIAVHAFVTKTAKKSVAPPLPPTIRESNFKIKPTV